MKCNNCGHELKPGSGFCENCGMIISIGNEQEDRAFSTGTDNSAEFDAIINDAVGEKILETAPPEPADPVGYADSADAPETEVVSENAGYEQPYFEEQPVYDDRQYQQDDYVDVSSVDESLPDPQEEVEYEPEPVPVEEAPAAAEVYEEVSEGEPEADDMLVPPSSKKKGKAPFIVAILLILGIAVGAGAYFTKNGSFDIKRLIPSNKSTTGTTAGKTTEEDNDDTTDSTTEAATESTGKVNEETLENPENPIEETEASESETKTTEQTTAPSSTKETEKPQTTETTKNTTAQTTKQSTTARTTAPSTTKQSTTKQTTTRPSTTKQSTTKQTTTAATKPQTTTARTDSRPDIVKKLKYPAIPEAVTQPKRYLASEYVAYIAAKKGAKLRSAPSDSAKVMYSARVGRELTVLGKEGDWLFTYSVYYNTYGWVKASLVSASRPSADKITRVPGLVEPNKRFSGEKTMKVHTSDSYLHLRKGPGKTYEVITSLTNGTPLKVLGTMAEDSTWTYVLEPTIGYEGWVLSSCLK